MLTRRRSHLIVLAIASVLLMGPAAWAEHEKELLKTKARTAYLTPDGKVLVAASKDNVRLVFLDVKKSRLIQKEYAPIYLSPDGKFLGIVGMLEVDDGLVPAPIYDLAKVEAGGAAVISNSSMIFAIAPGGKTCAFGSKRDLVLMDVKTGKASHTFTDVGGQPWSASFSHDGKYLACGTGSGKAQVVLYDVVKLKTARTFDKMPSVIQGVAFSQDGKLLAASSDDVVKVWDIATGKVVHNFVGPKDKLMRGLAFGAGGKVLASACSDGIVRIWDMPTGKTLDTIKLGVEAMRVSMSADGKVLAVTADDQFARVYDVSAALGR